METTGPPREKRLHELLSHHMVDIYVGPENTHWILHEKLLAAKSLFFNHLFYSHHPHGPSSSSGGGGGACKTIGFPDEEDEPFRLFVGWLYSGRVPAPRQEHDLGDLLDLYLMAEKWHVTSLVRDVLDAVRTWYRTTDTFPGLRRVQYVYANTDEDSPMRQLLISSIARMLVTRTTAMPPHWERALAKNGQMAVDMLRAVQLWRLDPNLIPDARDGPQVLEREKVHVVEQAEQHQDDSADSDATAGIDAAAEAPHDLEMLADRMY